MAPEISKAVEGPSVAPSSKLRIIEPKGKDRRKRRRDPKAEVRTRIHSNGA